MMFLSEQLHQNIEVLDHNVPPAELARAISAFGELLFPVPAGPPADSGHLIADADHYCYTVNRCASSHCRQRRLRRFCK